MAVIFLVELPLVPEAHHWVRHSFDHQHFSYRFKRAFERAHSRIGQVHQAPVFGRPFSELALGGGILRNSFFTFQRPFDMGHLIGTVGVKFLVKLEKILGQVFFSPGLFKSLRLAFAIGKQENERKKQKECAHVVER